MIVAYCYADGTLKFNGKVPEGAIQVSIAPERQPDKKMRENDQAVKTWREKIIARCRLAYDNKTLLVPGIPEADTMDQKLDALMRFRQIIGDCHA
jgi:hypothetical protein